MFFQTPSDEPHKTTTNVQLDSHSLKQRKNKNKKHKRAKRKINQATFKNKSQFAVAHTMSSWAENFTVAATWQLKQQLAFWKARAKALEYENGVLHDIIKNNYFRGSPGPGAECGSKTITDYKIVANDINEEIDDQSEGELEVSEEFIEFLKANAKYREDARQERERLKAKFEEENAQKSLVCDIKEPSNEDTETEYKKLYGFNWEKVLALETCMKVDFIEECDKEKPIYWPNIPFNFNFS